MEKTAIFRRWHPALPWVLLLLITSSTAAENRSIQSHDSIRHTAEQFVQSQYDSRDGKLTTRAGNLDSRLRLKACAQPLNAFFPNAQQNSTRRTVGIRCSDTKGWTLYVPVTVSLINKVVIASTEIPKKRVLTLADLRLEERDTARLKRGYYTRLSEAKGQVVKRALHEGDVILPSQLKAEKTIKRGSSITILAQSGGLQVRMSGKAMSDGAPGEQIKVINNSSKRKLEAIVVNTGLVKVVTH